MAQREIEAARAYSDSIVETIRQPLVVLDDDLRIISASKVFYETFGAKRQDAVGQIIGSAGALHFNDPGSAHLPRSHPGRRRKHRGL